MRGRLSPFAKRFGKVLLAIRAINSGSRSEKSGKHLKYPSIDNGEQLFKKRPNELENGATPYHVEFLIRDATIARVGESSFDLGKKQQSCGNMPQRKASKRST